MSAISRILLFSLILLLTCLLLLSLGCKKQEKVASEQKGKEKPVDEPQVTVRKYFNALEEKNYYDGLNCYNSTSKIQLSTPESKENFYDFANKVKLVEYSVLDQKIEGDTARVVISGVMYMVDGSENPTENQVYNLIVEGGVWKIDLTAPTAEEEELLNIK